MACDSGPRAEVGHPAIGQARGALHDHLALAPHPDGDAPPRRQRIDPGVGNAMPLAVDRHQLLGPERAHDRDLLLDALAAVLEVLAQRLELDGVPADAHAEPQAPARQHVDGGRLLGDEGGLPLREDQDARRQPQPAGHAGEKAEQHERLVERVPMGIRALPAARPLGVRPEDMVEGEHVCIAHPLDRLRVVADPRRIRSDLDLWEHDPDVHWPLLIGAALTSTAASQRRSVVRQESIPHVRAARADAYWRAESAPCPTKPRFLAQIRRSLATTGHAGLLRDDARVRRRAPVTEPLALPG